MYGYLSVQGLKVCSTVKITVEVHLRMKMGSW